MANWQVTKLARGADKLQQSIVLNRRMKEGKYIAQGKGQYQGVRRRLRGKEAIVIIYPWGVMAQFDDMKLPEAFGWHWFPRNDFIVLYARGPRELNG